MRISDEKLSAYIDGEVSAGDARMIEDAAAGNAKLARRLERLRELSHVLGETCSQIDRVPLPAKVMASLAPEAHREAAGAGELLRFPARKARRVPGRPAAALAASIALIAGIGLGAFFTRAALSPPEGQERSFAGIRAVSEPVSGVLETRPSGRAVPVAGSGQETVSVLPVLTFESGKGDFCREYVVALGEAAMRGLACREGGTWKPVAMMAQRPPARGASPNRYIAAEGPAPALFGEIVGSLDPREPLSAAAERKLIEKGWQR